MKKTIIFSILILAVFAGCKKNEYNTDFKAQARLLLSGTQEEGARVDSLSFTFAIWPPTLADTTVTVVAQCMGNLSGKDRRFDLEVDTATTAVAAEYELPASLVLPANAYSTTFKVKIKRSNRLKTSVVKLVIRVKANEEFLPGPVIGGTVNFGPVFRIVWTEVLTQPAIWNNSMLYAVGKWSQVKHQAIIDVTGIRNYDAINYSQTYAIAAIMLDWLTDYNASHPGAPLLDEKGQEVRICSQCN